MTSSTDWPQVDPMPSMVSSSDLFDGDILGDELIDIYNAAVVGGSDDDDPIHEIPSLLVTADDKEPESEPTLSADDGLGAFRPSTSFNDLAGLLPPSNATVAVMPSPVASAVAPSVAAVPAPAASVAKPAPASVSSGANTPLPAASMTSLASASATAAGGGSSAVAVAPANAVKKRAPPTTSAPAAKRRAISGGGRKGPDSPKSKEILDLNVGITTPNTTAPSTTPNATAPSTVNTSAAAVAKLPEKRITPNPLMLANLPVGKSIIKKPIVVKPAVVASNKITASAAPAVVSPRAQQTQKPIAAKSVPAPATAPLVPTTTEADFKSVAQAAVSSLIMNAGSKAPESCSIGAPVAAAAVAITVDSKDLAIRVDTSTEHIKALTGSNWVAVCAPPDGAQTPTSVDKTNAANNNANNRARRQNLTPDERARQNRDRNREHARNTRLRKKAYVEELKRTLTELVAQRDTADLERRHAAQRELEQREVRFRVMEEFLKLRGRNEPHAPRWAAILEDGFVFTLPVTDFRKMAHEHASLIMEQSLTGVAETMIDSTNFSLFLQTFHGGGPSLGTRPVTFVYNCERTNFFMDNCNAVLDWTATSEGAVQQGATAELALKGTLRARFSPASNKLISADMAFDTGLVTSQLSYLVPSDIKGEDTDMLDVDAAQAAASEADAILDSLQMPLIETTVPTNVTVVPPSLCSENSSGASVTSADESLTDAGATLKQNETA